MDYLNFGTICYACSLGLVAIGLFGMVTTTHLFRMVLALAIAEAGGNLFLVLAGWRPEAVAPILRMHAAGTAMVDPIPQSLVLTSIVIGVGVQALAVAIILRIHHRYGTLDMRELRERFELEVSAAAGIGPPGSAQAPAGKRPLPPAIPTGLAGQGASRARRDGNGQTRASGQSTTEQAVTRPGQPREASS